MRSRRRRRLLRGLLAGAVIGLVEAAGLDPARRAVRRPLRVVWLDDREPRDPLAGVGLWFLEPLGDPRPGHGDVRRPVAGGLRLLRLGRRAVLGSLRGRDS